MKGNAPMKEVFDNSVLHLRVLDTPHTIPEREHCGHIIVQGYFGVSSVAGPAEAVRDYIIKRGIGETGTFRVMRDCGDGWAFYALITINASDYKETVL